MRPRPSIRCAFACVIAMLLCLPVGIQAQQGQETQALTREQLDQMVAPIALYPDDLLAQVFMASTYPLEVVQAARWIKENPKLKGAELEAALKKKNWDPAVKSLLPFPDVLAMMNDNLEWTQKIGDAFLSQQKDVMDSVQRLRGQAQEAGNLKTTKEQKVIVEKSETTQIIRVEPTTQVVYVPTYNPAVVYGAWAYPAYPPAPVYPPGYVAGTALLSFGVGVAVGSAMYGGWNWHHGDVEVNHNYNVNRSASVQANRAARQANVTPRGGGTTWQHNPQHRQNVPYRNQDVARQYNQTPAARAQAQQNLNARGYGSSAPGVRGVSATQSAREPGAFSGSRNGTAERAASTRGQYSRDTARASSGFSRTAAASPRATGAGAGFSGGGARSGGGRGGGFGGGGRGGGGRGGRR